MFQSRKYTIRPEGCATSSELTTHLLHKTSQRYFIENISYMSILISTDEDKLQYGCTTKTHNIMSISKLAVSLFLLLLTSMFPINNLHQIILLHNGHSPRSVNIDITCLFSTRKYRECYQFLRMYATCIASTTSGWRFSK